MPHLYSYDSERTTLLHRTGISYRAIYQPAFI